MLTRSHINNITPTKNSADGLVVCIDASRIRSGGALAHLRGIIHFFDTEIGIKTIHLCGHQSLLDSIKDQHWLVKHHHPFLERSVIYQLIWQACILKKLATELSCDILFAPDASTVCYFSPLVVLSQDLLSYEPGVMQSYAWGRERFRLEVLKIIQNFAFRRSCGVLFLTKYAAELVQRSSGSLSKTAFAPHGVDEEFRNIAASRIKSEDVNVIKCVYVSNADRYKNHEQVIEAFSILRNRGFAIELQLIGGGKGVAKSKLLKTIERYDIGGQFVRQLDFVRHSELPVYLKQADLFIFASSCENLPVTLLEGMAAGLPIACSDRGPMPEILKDGGVYFDPENCESIADAIERLIESNELCDEISRTARVLASSYTWSNCSRNTFEFIKNAYYSDKGGL